MIRAYAVSSVRQAEAEAVAAGVPESELMSRAASGLAAVASARLGGPGGRRVVVPRLVVYPVGRYAASGSRVASPAAGTDTATRASTASNELSVLASRGS